MKETDYPYTGYDGTCKRDQSKTLAKVVVSEVSHFLPPPPPPPSLLALPPLSHYTFIIALLSLPRSLLLGFSVLLFSISIYTLSPSLCFRTTLALLNRMVLGLMKIPWPLIW